MPGEGIREAGWVRSGLVAPAAAQDQVMALSCLITSTSPGTTKMEAKMAAGRPGTAERGGTEADEAGEQDARQGRAGHGMQTQPGRSSGVTSRPTSKMG